MPQSGLAFASKNIGDAQFENFGIYVMKVVAVNWQDHTVDLLTEGGTALQHVAIALTWGGSDYGDRHLPQVDAGVDPARPFGDGNRETWALVAFTRGSTLHPIVLGFVYGEVSQMMIEGFQKLTRHVGDTFQAVSMDGDIWMGFTPDGSHVGFHYDNPAPPAIHGTDYDRLANPATGKEPSFSAVLANGSTVHLDGKSGNILHIASRHLHQEAKGQLDLLGQVITFKGLPAIYPAERTALTSAPSSDDPLIEVAHLTTNAAHNYIPPIAGTGPEGQGVMVGWTYLAHGAASRVEIALDGKLRTFKAPVGFIGDTINWEEVPATGGAAPYIVPPPEPYNLTFACRGDQRILWVCPPTPEPITIVFLDSTLKYVVANAVVTWTTGTYTLKKNFSTVAIPLDGASPLTVVEGDILELVTSGTVEADGRLLLSLWGINSLPDTEFWWDVDPTTDPPTVTPPA